MDEIQELLEKRRQELLSDKPSHVSTPRSGVNRANASQVRTAVLPGDNTDCVMGDEEGLPSGDHLTIDSHAVAGLISDSEPAVPGAVPRGGGLSGPAVSGGELGVDAASAPETTRIAAEPSVWPAAAHPPGVDISNAEERAASGVSRAPPSAVSRAPEYLGTASPRTPPAAQPSAAQPSVASDAGRAEGDAGLEIEGAGVDAGVEMKDSGVDGGVDMEYGGVSAGVGTEDSSVGMGDGGVSSVMVMEDGGAGGDQAMEDGGVDGDRAGTRAPVVYDGEPRLVTSVTTPFGADNFTKGCKWSPDGTCLLVCSEDARLRVLNLPEPLYAAAVASTAPAGSLPEPAVALQSREGELIYDYAWFPLMRSDEPATCCYASSSRAHPVHLFDAFDGALRCSYRTYNNVDEVAAAYSVAFDPAGERLYAGLDGCLSVFDVSRPGRQIETRKMKDKRSLTAQPGIVSCIGFCAAAPDIYAAGTYLRSIGLYDTADGSPLCLLQGQTGGVTHLQFSPDGTRLYSGGRKDPEILCWDLRNLGQILYSLQRNVTTNQRMYFDSDWSGRYMFSGDSDGCVQVWDTLATPSDIGDTLVLPSIRKFGAHFDCCNGVSAHPWLPVLATSSGQRHLPCPLDSSDEETEHRPTRTENAVKLWWLGS